MTKRSTTEQNSLVIAGLDPAIHCADARNDIVWNGIARTFDVDAEPGRSVDCRVKPCNDDSFSVLR